MASGTIKQPSLIVEEITCGAITVEANGNGHATGTISKSGYKPLGVVGIVNISNAAYIYEYVFGNTYVDIFIRNIGNTQISGTMRVKILYTKA